MPSLLRLALDRPLHLATDNELSKLVNWLEETQWERQEKYITEAIEHVLRQWHYDCERASLANLQTGPYHVAGAPAFHSAWGRNPQVMPASWETLTVKLPVWIPDQYAKPFIERQIREQLEDWEQLDERSSDS